jgi:hypothetical protein
MPIGLAAMTIVAAIRPVRGALHVDPMSVLRQE